MPQPLAERTNNWKIAVGLLARDCPRAGSSGRAGMRTVQGLGSVGPSRNPGARNRQARQAAEPYQFGGPAEPEVPVQRRSGRPVYIKPTFDQDVILAQFMYVDSKDQFVPTHYITWKNNKTEEEVRAEAMDAWDRLETPRIRNFNRSMAVYWARLRLLRHKLRGAGLMNEATSLEHAEHFDLMQEVFTAKDAIHKAFTSLQTTHSLMHDTPPFGISSIFAV